MERRRKANEKTNTQHPAVLHDAYAAAGVCGGHGDGG